MKLAEFFQLLRSAIERETSEGEAFKARYEELKAKFEAQGQAIASLQAQLEGTQAELASALGTTQEEMLSMLEQLGNVNPTPVSDALIEAVQNNPNVDTPQELEDVTVPSLEVTETEAVEASLEVLEEVVEE